MDVSNHGPMVVSKVLLLEASERIRLGEPLEAVLASLGAPRDESAIRKQLMDFDSELKPTGKVVATIRKISERRALVEEKGWFAFRTFGADGGHQDEPILAKPFRLDRVVQVSGKLIVEGEDEAPFSMEPGDLLRRIRKSGKALEPRRVEAMLNALQLLCEDRAKGEPVFGIIAAEDGRLSVVETVVPTTAEQRTYHDSFKPFHDFPPTPGDWQAYADLVQRYELKEWAPAAGLSSIAPLAYLLRGQHPAIMIPHVIHFARQTGVGKTTIGEAFSACAWKSPTLQGRDLNSEFRFGYYAGIQAPICVNEAQGFSFDRYGDLLKHCAEKQRFPGKGTKDLEIKVFESYATWIFTTNFQPAIGQDVSSRIFVVHFNEERVNQSSEAKKAVEALVASLVPTGAAEARQWGLGYRDIFGFIASLKDQAGRFKAMTRSMDWDPRRDSMWALVYLGLVNKHNASGGIIPLPSEAEFVAQVIEPVERDTMERIADPLEIFQGWFAGYLAKDPPIHEEGRVVGRRSEGWEYQSHYLDGVSGHLVAANVLRKGRAELKRDGIDVSALPGSLPDLARMISKAHGIPLGKFLDANGNAKQHRFQPAGGDERGGVHAVFVPNQGPGGGKVPPAIATLLQPSDNRREHA